MCGLVCVITKQQNGFNKEQQDVFELLLFIDTLRGEDSTGTFLVENNGNVHLAKDALNGANFIETNEYQSLKRKAWSSGWAMVGHNRKATRGQITDKNAHPFVVDNNIVLVHNGSYFGDHKHLKDTEVDSEAIAHHISDAGDNIEEAMRKVHAAYALIWYNVEKKQLHILRNDQRPLWHIETPNAYIFASEKSFLEFAITRCNLKPKEAPYLLADEYLLTYTLKDNRNTDFVQKEVDVKYRFQQTQHTNLFPHGQATPVRQIAHHNIEDACGYWPGCGWGEFDGYEGAAEDVPFRTPANDGNSTPRLPAPETPVVDTSNIKEHFGKEPVNTPRYIAGEKMYDVLGENAVVTKFKEYQSTAEKIKTGQKLRVIINDMIEADDNPKTTNFFLMGETLDDSKIHVSLPMKENDFSKLMKCANEAIFEIEVDAITWKRTDLKGSTNMEDWEGMMILHGKNPVQIVPVEGEEHRVQ
jgi:hypothetical protein